MQKTLAILFLSLFVVGIIRPILPYIDYALNKEYIAEELCENKEEPEMQCNGKCHLAKEVKKVVEEEESPTKSPVPNKKKNIEKPMYLVTEYFSWNATIDAVSDRLSICYTAELVVCDFQEIPTPPPQVVS